MTSMQLFYVLCFIQYACGFVHHPEVGITGGHKIPISEAPYMASLVRSTEKLPNNKHVVTICGGSIVHRRFILTAAHCVEGDSYRDVVRVGSSKLHSGGTTYEVKKFISHKNYSSDEIDFTYDIALVKLKKRIKFGKNVAKIVLADEDLKIEPHTTVNVTGYGKTRVKGAISEKLQQVSVKLRPIDECMVYPWVTEDMLCVWSYHKGSCKGDSGGPMTLNKVQIGVVSNGLACGFLPSIYTKVSFLSSWINENIKENL